MVKEKKYDLTKVLEKVSGIPKKETLTIWEEVKANHKRLNECAGPHNFQKLDSSKFGSKFQCSLCGGTVDVIAYSWYNKGLEHGKQKK